MKKEFKLLSFALIALTAICAIFYYINLSPKTAETSEIYNAKKTLTGTGITIAFPKDGYNKEGVELGYSDNASIMVLDKIANLYILSNPNGSPQIEVGVYSPGEKKSLAEILQVLEEQQFPEIADGEYKTINGTKFFIHPSTDGSMYSAYTLVNEQFLNVNMFYSLNEDHEKLPSQFNEILQRIDFNCELDCSVNVGPVTNMGKQGEQ